MKLIVGLGNPGKKYQNTRHNTGYLVINKMAQAAAEKKCLRDNKIVWEESRKGKLEYLWFEAGGEKVELAKPLTFMNDSGKALAYIRKKHPELKNSDLYLAHDDLDIKLGEYKICWGKGPKIHNGLNSVYQRLGTKKFWHIRLGIENRVQNFEKQIEGQKYVLMKFSREEEQKIEAVAEQVVSKLWEAIK